MTIGRFAALIALSTIAFALSGCAQQTVNQPPPDPLSKTGDIAGDRLTACVPNAELEVIAVTVLLENTSAEGITVVGVRPVELIDASFVGAVEAPPWAVEESDNVSQIAVSPSSDVIGLSEAPDIEGARIPPNESLAVTLMIAPESPGAGLRGIRADFVDGYSTRRVNVTSVGTEAEAASC